MSGELALRLMPLHPNEQQNEHVGDANECERHRNANFVAAARELQSNGATRPLSQIVLQRASLHEVYLCTSPLSLI